MKPKRKTHTNNGYGCHVIISLNQNVYDEAGIEIYLNFVFVF